MKKTKVFTREDLYKILGELVEMIYAFGEVIENEKDFEQYRLAKAEFLANARNILDEIERGL